MYRVPQDSEEPNIGRILGLLRRRGIWIVLCFALACAAAFGYSKHQTKKYTATTSVVFSSNQLSQEIAGLSSSNTSSLLQQSNNLELLHLGDMAARTASILGHGLTEESVDASLSIAGQPESNIAGVVVTTTSPELSATIANTYARQFVREQQSTNRQYFRSALALVHKQLEALTPEQRNGVAGVALQDRAQSLGLLSQLQPNTVQIAQEASIPTSPSSPKTSRNTLIGGILGLFLGVGLALLLERLDPRIRDSDELEAIYRLPLLGIVPQSTALSRSVRNGEDTPLTLPFAEAEAFHTIRARLRSFNADRDIRTVLVASAALAEGKTTVARHLAGAAAGMGSRVLLMEVDLRRPTLAQQLNIPTGPGLSDVLIGVVSMNEAIQTVDFKSLAGDNRKELVFDVLVAGAMPPINPVELIESNAMDALLAEAKSNYDLIVIDTPELTAVSDAFLLLPKVDGVIIIGRMGHSRRDVAKRLGQLLETSGAPLVGIVANGVKSSGRGRNTPVYEYAGGHASTVASLGGAADADEHVPSVIT